MNMSFRIAITTLGCKTNQYDTAEFLGRLAPEVFKQVSYRDEADAYIINSCTVTAVADRQSRQFAYQARRRAPEALVIITGCYATKDQKELEGLKVFDYVIPRGYKERTINVLAEKARSMGYKPRPVELGPRFESRSRPYLKIQDGCDSACAYCIIPKVRGPVTSLPMMDVIKGIESLAKEGFKEAVLTGIHIGQWGRDLPGKPAFASLLEDIDKAALIPRIRISSIEPLELTDKLIEIIAGSDCFCPHLHIPLQSGSDSVLERMRRPYRTSKYRERIEKAHEAIPGLGLGIDVIVGFPGESEEEFMETFDFLSDLPFTYLHVFPFSARPGTTAADMEDQVSPDIRKRRARQLISLGRARRRESASRQVGKCLRLLIERKRHKPSGFWQGFSDNYHHCLVKSEEDIQNTLISVSPTGLVENGHSLLSDYEHRTDGEGLPA